MAHSHGEEIVSLRLVQRINYFDFAAAIKLEQRRKMHRLR